MKKVIFFVLITSQSAFAALTICNGKEKNMKLVITHPKGGDAQAAMLSQNDEFLVTTLTPIVVDGNDQKMIAGEMESSSSVKRFSLNATKDLSSGIVSYTENGKKAILDKVTCVTQ